MSQKLTANNAFFPFCW